MYVVKSKKKTPVVQGTNQGKKIFATDESARTTQSNMLSQKNEKERLKQRAKHHIKVHLWDGILKRAATKFSGIMNTDRLEEIYVRQLN